MLWLSHNYYDNYVCVILMQLLFKKLGCFGSPKIIIIIATSLTSNNFIDAPLIAQEYNKPILKWGKQHFPRCKQMSSQESEGGHTGHT